MGWELALMVEVRLVLKLKVGVVGWWVASECGAGGGVGVVNPRTITIN